MTTTFDPSASQKITSRKTIEKIPSQPTDSVPPSSDSSASGSASASVEPVRLAFAPGGHGTGALDGAWWPRSRDLEHELPGLAEAMDAPFGRITRVLVNPAHWLTIPRRVRLPERLLHVGWFAAEQDPHKVIVRSYTVGRWDLLVIPPETTPDTAARLMAAAADPENRLTASALMAVETDRTTEEEAIAA
ncbi:DUF5994 family protein [Streptomyces sp. NPDC051569]|uniref:DUF5994 family protein n=1 Tax=Streptomyces sp. NPDC051569 TaxID=3365661 RepID=UPI0037B1B82A